jgi:hypothetical protein
MKMDSWRRNETRCKANNERDGNSFLSTNPQRSSQAKRSGLNSLSPRNQGA